MITRCEKYKLQHDEDGLDGEHKAGTDQSHLVSPETGQKRLKSEMTFMST